MAYKVELKPIKIFRDVDNYKDMLTTVLNHPSNGQGMSFSEARKSGAILDALDEAAEDGKSEVILEDDQFNLLKQKIEAFPWPNATKLVRQFGEDVLNSEKVDFNKMKKEKVKDND